MAAFAERMAAGCFCASPSSARILPPSNAAAVEKTRQSLWRAELKSALYEYARRHGNVVAFILVAASGLLSAPQLRSVHQYIAAHPPVLLFTYERIILALSLPSWAPTAL